MNETSAFSLQRLQTTVTNTPGWQAGCAPQNRFNRFSGFPSEWRCTEDMETERTEQRKTATADNARGSGMGLAVAIFQIAIALGSICLMTKKQSLWYLSLVLAGLATAKMVVVWLS